MKIFAVSDLHLSSTRPLCRTDSDWVATEKSHLARILKAVDEMEVDHLYIGGDVFDTPTVSPVIVNMFVDFLFDVKSRNVHIHLIAGNHDLPYHNINKISEASFGVLRSLIPTSEFCYDFGCEEPNVDADVVMLHHYTVRTVKDKLPLMTCYTAEELMEMYPNAKVIIAGDNHDGFVVKAEKQIVINCGCMMKRTATEVARPCGGWFVDTGNISCTQFVDFSELNTEVDLTYLEDGKLREEHKEAYDEFVSELKEGITQSYDFISTLEEYLHKTEKDIEPDVAEFMECIVNYLKGV